ncbi:MAG: glycosyltransferase family 4 protein, partial [Oscillospiraceae bacterium]
ISIFLNYISYPFTACFNLFRLWGKKYDAVFSYQTSPVMMSLPAIIYAKCTKTPLTIYVLDLWPENLYSVLNIKNEFLRKICKSVSLWHYKRADKLIAMGEGLQKKLVDITQKDISKIYCIPQYCEKMYEEKVVDENLQKRFDGKFNVLFAGNFSPAQGLDVLIYLAKRLKNEENSHIHFVMVGDGMSHDDFVSKVDQNGLNEYFTFEGQKPITEIPAYQTMADVLFAGLSASDYIGLTVPAKVSSYIAAGKPILLCMNGEAAELIAKIGCGFTAPAEDGETLFGELMRIYNMSESERETLGKKAKEYHEKYLKREIVLEKLQQAIL